ncbi:MAG: YkgJ family cysteine cluster protein, partial [Candidatus Thermoplasmatota archaeon]
AELFAQLRQVHRLLTAYQDAHNRTDYGCQRSGHCCQVGLQLPLMECEHIAEFLRTRTRGRPKALLSRIEALKRAFTDPTWNWASSIGDQYCAFYDDGCTIYEERPSICRMYGVLLEVDEWCPRERLANGRSFVYIQPDVDRLVKSYYKTLDDYGRLLPKHDYTMFMPAGVLSFLLSPAELKEFKASTPKRFWKREKGYRTQYKMSPRRGRTLQTNVKFHFAIGLAAGAR